MRRILTYHRYAGIESISALQSAEVYPNPFSESVTIQLTGNITNMQMELVDLFGRKLMEGKITTNTTTISTTTAADNPNNIVPIATETPVRDSLISQELYPDGKLKSRCVFAATDTIEQINPETLEELVIVSVSTGTTSWYYFANGKLSYLSERA